MPLLARLAPYLGESMRRFGARQVRAVGTVGGNVANGSPIGDLNVALIALGATVELRRGDRVRALPLDRFFLGYRRQDRAPGEFVRRLIVPKPGPDERFRAYKVSKRFDEDISAVMGAFKLTVEGPCVGAARLAFGGMAEVPRRAEGAETALRGARLDDRAAWEPALAALGRDFAPLSDHRASAGYRGQVARNLLVKALIEIGGAPTRTTRLVGHREGADGAR